MELEFRVIMIILMIQPFSSVSYLFPKANLATFVSWAISVFYWVAFLAENEQRTCLALRDYKPVLDMNLIQSFYKPEVAKTGSIVRSKGALTQAMSTLKSGSKNSVAHGIAVSSNLAQKSRQSEHTPARSEQSLSQHSVIVSFDAKLAWKLWNIMMTEFVAPAFLYLLGLNETHTSKFPSRLLEFIDV